MIITIRMEKQAKITTKAILVCTMTRKIYLLIIQW